MREIKFRAWDDHNKVMKIYTLKELAGEDKFGYDTEFEAIQSGFDNWIWMEFTGLKDKNGIEIYEGDIVRAEGYRERFIQVIEFHNTQESCGRGWIGRNIIQDKNTVFNTPQKRIDDMFSYFCWPTSWEVIGNIYENPELLSPNDADNLVNT